MTMKKKRKERKGKKEKVKSYKCVKFTMTNGIYSPSGLPLRYSPSGRPSLRYGLKRVLCGCLPSLVRISIALTQIERSRDFLPFVSPIGRALLPMQVLLRVAKAT